MARWLIASARAASRPRNSRNTPRQVRNPCSGCGRRASTARISASVLGPLAAVAPRVARHPLAAVEHFDGARRDAGIHLLADQRVRHRVEEALGLNMVVDADAGEAPLGILVVLLGQRLHGRPLDGLEQLASADAQAAYLAAVHPLENDANRGIAFGQGKEVDVAQATKNIRLRKADSGLHLGLVFWLSWSCRYNTNVVVCRHFTVGAIYFGVIK